MGMDERQRDAGIEEHAPDDEQDRAKTEAEPAGTEPDRIWGARRARRRRALTGT